MALTSDQTSAGSSGPVLTIDQTSPLATQGRPDCPDLFARVYMEDHPIKLISKPLNRYGQSGHLGQLNSPKASRCPDLPLMVGTVRTGGMFHANPHGIGPAAGRGAHGQAPSARVLLAFWNCGQPSAQCSCMFRVPSLVPMEHGGSK